jgi:hypothetical protein
LERQRRLDLDQASDLPKAVASAPTYGVRKDSMNSTLLVIGIFLASLAVTVATATAAEVGPRNAGNVASVDVYKDPG